MSAVIESYKTLIQAGDLPPLSQVGLEILRLGERDDLSAAQLGRIISKDAALAAKVLRIANSPFYGLPTRVKTIDHAIVVLGRVCIVSICAAFTLLSTLQIPKMLGHERYESYALRSHSILTALLTRWLAQQCDSPRVSVSGAFLGALLHDIGELAIAVYYTGHLGEIREYEHNQPDTTSCQAETAILGFDHQEFGAEVLNAWHMPQLYIEMARHHHEPAHARDAGEDMMRVLLQAADHLADVLQDGPSRGVIPGQTKPEEWQETWMAATKTIQGVPKVTLEILGKNIETILNEARTMTE